MYNACRIYLPEPLLSPLPLLPEVGIHLDKAALGRSTTT